MTKLCVDCKFYEPPALIEAEKERQKNLRWWNVFDVAMPSSFYPDSYYYHQCLKVKSLITGKPEKIPAEYERRNAKRCGPTGKWWEAK